MFALTVLALSAVASVSATLTNITITDQSPTIKYSPSRWGDSAETWNVSYTGNDWATFSPGNLAKGTSEHFTTYIGATATFGFRGTAISLSGTGSAGDFTVTVGGEDISKTGGVDGILAQKDGLKNQWWNVVLKVPGSGGVSLTGITFTVNVGNDGAALTPRVIPALNAQNGPNPDLSFSGQNQWGNRTVVGDVAYNRIDTNVGSARVVLPAITGETLIIGYGSVNYDHGRFSMDSSGPVAGWPGTDTFNGSSPYMSLDQIIFFGMADWGVMSITNLDAGSWLDISSISYTTASGGTPNTGSNGTSGDPDSGDRIDNTDSGGGGTPIGIIVGAAVGGAVFVALLGVLIWVCLRRRRRASAAYHSPNQVDNTRYEIDPYTETTVAVPDQNGYFDNPEMAYANAASGISPTSAYGSKSAQSRNSFASMAGYVPGLTPYQPQSPGMSEGSSGHRSSSAIDQSSSQTSASRLSKSPRQLPVPGNQIRQEMDAGRVALVPPSYDPTWAQDGPAETSVIDREEVSPVPSAPVQTGQTKR